MITRLPTAVLKNQTKTSKNYYGICDQETWSEYQRKKGYTGFRTRIKKFKNREANRVNFFFNGRKKD